MTRNPTCCPLLAFFVRTPLCLRVSSLDLDSVSCAWLVTIPLEAALHQVLHVLSWEVSSLSTLRLSVQNLSKYLVASFRLTAAWVLANPLVQSTVQVLSDHSISAAEKWKTPIPLLVNNSVASSGVRGWHLIRSRAALTTSLVALISPFPVPQYPRYLHASLRFIAWRVSPLIVNSGAGSCSLRF